MGQITVDNQYDADYWKKRLYEITGAPPKVEGTWNYQVTITVPDALLPQEAIDAMKSMYDRNRARGVVEVNVGTVTPPITEREQVILDAMRERAKENALLREHNQATADEREERDGFTPLP